MPKARLSRLILQNFKSIPSADISLSGMTFLVGRNGSGKSNISDAFAFLAEAMEQPLQSVLNRRGGPASVAHKVPNHLDHPPRQAREMPLGIAVEFSSLPTYMERNSLIVRARYALEIVTQFRGYFVSREQCSLHYSDGTVSWFERDGKGLRSNIEIFQSMSSSMITRESLWIQTFGGLIEFAPLTYAIRSMAVYAIEPATLREFQNHDPQSRLLPDGSNAASVLQRLISQKPAELERLVEIMSSIIPDLGDVRAVQVGRKQVLRFYQSWISPEFGRERLNFDAFNMSDGTLRSFGILLAVFQPERPSLILIEEPETSIHPAATSAILELLRSVSSTTQIVLTTHSPEVLDFASREDGIRVVSWSNGATRVSDVGGAAKEALQHHLSSPGELFRMRILDAAAFNVGEAAQVSLFEELN